METWRSIPPEDLRQWRQTLAKGHQRAVGQPARQKRMAHPVEQVGDAAMFETDDFKPVDPRTAKERMEQQILGWGKKSRENFQILAQQLRAAQPALTAHLTDEQIAEKLEREWDEKVRASVARVYHRNGRADELQIKTAGW